MTSRVNNTTVHYKLIRTYYIKTVQIIQLCFVMGNKSVKFEQRFGFFAR